MTTATRTLKVAHRLNGRFFNEAYDVTDDRDRDVLYVYRSTGDGFVFARMVGTYVQTGGFATAHEAFVAGMASLRALKAWADAPVVEQTDALAASDQLVADEAAAADLAAAVAYWADGDEQADEDDLDAALGQPSQGWPREADVSDQGVCPAGHPCTLVGTARECVGGEYRGAPLGTLVSDPGSVTYRCDDCRSTFPGEPHYSLDVEACQSDSAHDCTGALCARCAGPFLTPDRA